MAASKELHERIDGLNPEGWLALLAFLRKNVEQGNQEFLPLLDTTKKLVDARAYVSIIKKENSNP